MAYHDVDVDTTERGEDGFLRWRAGCRTCHWFTRPLPSRRAAEDAADEHVLNLVGYDDSVTDEGVPTRHDRNDSTRFTTANHGSPGRTSS